MLTGAHKRHHIWFHFLHFRINVAGTQNNYTSRHITILLLTTLQYIQHMTTKYAMYVRLRHDHYSRFITVSLSISYTISHGRNPSSFNNRKFNIINTHKKKSSRKLLFEIIVSRTRLHTAQHTKQQKTKNITKNTCLWKQTLQKTAQTKTYNHTL